MERRQFVVALTPIGAGVGVAADGDGPRARVEDARNLLHRLDELPRGTGGAHLEHAILELIVMEITTWVLRAETETPSFSVSAPSAFSSALRTSVACLLRCG